MTKEEYMHLESEQQQHFMMLEHEQRRINIGQVTALELAQKANCKITKDGDKWCCLWGENMQEGIAGFGKYPLEAIHSWAMDFGMF